MLPRYDQRHGKVVRRLRRKCDRLWRDLERRALAALANLHHKQLRLLLRFLLDEAKHVAGRGFVVYVHRRETTCVPLERLRHALVDAVQLHVAVDRTVGALGNPHQQQPLPVRACLIVYDLAVRKRSVPVEHLHGSRVAVHGPVHDRCLRHHRDRVWCDPPPESDVCSFRQLVALHLRLHLNIENLHVLAAPQREYLGSICGGRGSHATQTTYMIVKTASWRTARKGAEQNAFRRRRGALQSHGAGTGLRHGVHDCSFSANGARDVLAARRQVDNGQLRLARLLLQHTDVFVGLHRELSETYVIAGKAHLRQIHALAERDGEVLRHGEGWWWQGARAFLCVATRIAR